MKLLSKEQKEAKEWWEAITNTLTVQQGPLEEPPRILSFDELKNLSSYTYVWLENLIDDTIKGCEISQNPFKDNNIVSIFAGGYYSLVRKNYGKKYQCWTAYPEGRNGKIRLLHRSDE